jgi:hypothetical protein
VKISEGISSRRRIPEWKDQMQRTINIGVNTMKTSRLSLLIAAVVALIASSGMAAPAHAAKDRTHYDCKVIVGYKTINRGQKIPMKVPIWECPHKDLMAAGKCETHWLFGMRCKE